MKVVAPISDQGGTQYGVAKGVAPAGLRLNGRGLAAADVDNDGRMEIAVNSIGGKLLLLKPTGKVGHWLDVRLSRFSPGAVVTVVSPSGKATQSQEVRAGGSYLSSEDQQLHFGLGSDTRAGSVSVRYPWGGESVLRNVRADRVVTVEVPPQRAVHVAAPASYRLPACTPATGGRSIATVWEETAVDALRSGAASEPVQARDLFDVSVRDVGRLEGERRGQRVRPRRGDQLCRLPGAPLGRLLRLEPEPHVRAPDERAARALLLAGLHRHERTIAGGARKPDRRGRDRRRPARRLERVAALRRPDLHVAEPAPDRPRGRFHRGERGLLAAAGARGDPAAQPDGGAGGRAELRRRGVGPRSQLRAPTFAPRPSHRPGRVAAPGSVERCVQAGCGGRPARDLGERSRAAGVVAADLELARRPPGDGRSRQGRPALPRPRRRAQRRRGRVLGSEARLPGAAADLDDPLPRVPGPVERPQAGALQRRRAAARPRPRRAPRRQGRGALAGPLGRRRCLVTAGRHAAVARRRRRGKRVRVRGRRGPERADRTLVRERRSGRRPRRRSPTGSTSRRT